MAITRTVSNLFKTELGKGTVDLTSDAYKLILLEVGFVYDKDAHGTYADVSANEIATGYGYTQNTTAPAIDSAWAQDNVNDKASLTWADITFTAAGGDIEDFVAAIIYDDTHASNVIIGCIEFGQTISVTSGNSYTLEQLGFDGA